MENITRSKNESFGYQMLPGAKESFYIALALQWLNTFLIIPLNIAVIITIVQYKKKSRLYFLLMNMAIADLTTGVIDVLVNAIERTLGMGYFNYVWFGGDFLCKLQRTLSSTSLCASNFILAATSLDRAFVIAKPMLTFKRGYNLQKILIIVCWLSSAIISAPIIVVVKEEEYHPVYIGGGSNISLCTTSLSVDGWKVLFLLMFIFYFLLPLTIITASYSILLYAIYRRAKKPPNYIRGIDNLRISLVFNKGLPSSKKRSIKLTFGIILSFIGAWTPFLVVLYMSIFNAFNNPIIMPFITTYYWNCAVNPIIFFVFHKRRIPPTPGSQYSSDTQMNKLRSGRRDE